MAGNKAPKIESNGGLGGGLVVRRVSLSELHADPANTRTHDEKNLAAIADSLARFGQVEPLVVQRGTGMVIGGNGRLAAMRAAGTLEADIVEVDADDAKAAALSIALNRTAELAGWDDAALAKTLEALPKELQIGWTDEDLAAVLDKVKGPVVEDEAPEPLDEPVSRTGDLWELGGHKLLCGDSTKGEDVERVMGGERADVCLTDPPYGCGEAYASHDDTQEALGTLAKKFFALARERCGVVALTPGIQNLRHYPASDWMLCWFYGVGTGRTPWGFTCWQPVLVYGKDPYLARGLGCYPDGVKKLMSSEDMKENRALEHACPKPVSVWVWFLERVSPVRGQTVYEPFLGSGTTLIAAEQLGRRCYAIEIEPRYVDVAVRRWQKLTGKDAKLDGKTFAEVASERGVPIG